MTLAQLRALDQAGIDRSSTPAAGGQRFDLAALAQRTKRG